MRVVRSMYLPAALHGMEASLLASESLRKLRSSIRRVVWSRRQPLASVGAVLGLLDGPTGCDPTFCGLGFVSFVGIWLCGPPRLVVLIVFLKWSARVALVMVLSIFSLLVLLKLASGGILLLLLGLGLGYLCLAIWLALFSISRLLFLMLGVIRSLLIFAAGRGFRGGPLLDVHGSLQLLTSSHVRERDKALRRSIMVGGVWNGLLLGRVRGQAVPCRFCGAPDGDGHLFWECTFPPLVEIRESPEFHDLMDMDKGHWPRCLLWHGWLSVCFLGLMVPLLGLLMLLRVFFYLVETALGRYSSGLVSKWSLPDGFDAGEVSARMPDAPKVWSDGSLVLDSVAGVSAAGAGMFAHKSELCWSDRRWVMLIAFSPMMFLIPWTFADCSES